MRSSLDESLDPTLPVALSPGQESSAELDARSLEGSGVADRPCARPRRTTALVWLLAVVTAPWPAPVGAQAPFLDATESWRLAFEHHTGATGKLYFPEIMGSGAALFDYDGDGDLDTYLVQSGALKRGTDSEVRNDRLFRQDRGPGDEARFVDVTEGSGIDANGYGIGVAIGDIDGDGWLDLYVTNFGPNQLWRNRGDGTFEDWTERAGVAGNEWSSSATFFDSDEDGRLDLYVANYVDYDLDDPPTCYTANTAPEYCGPTAFEPTRDRLYRNMGGGRFEDASRERGIDAVAGAGLGVVALDVDEDDDLDLFVANDQMENFLWINQGDGRFEEAALWWGVSLNLHGRPEASMGIAPADFDADGDQDLFVTHLNGESSTLYLLEGDTYVDRTRVAGLAAPTRGRTSFGISWADVDDDGLHDLWVTNGEVRALEPLVARDDPRPYHQRDQLFRNMGGARFGPGLGDGGESPLSETGRGVASGDVDGDGDLDLLLSNNEGPARLLLDAGPSGGAVSVRAPSLEDRAALVSATLVGNPPQRRWLRRDGSFASSSEALLRFTFTAPTADLLVDVAARADGRRLHLRGVPRSHDLWLLWPASSDEDTE